MAKRTHKVSQYPLYLGHALTLLAHMTHLDPPKQGSKGVKMGHSGQKGQ